MMDDLAMSVNARATLEDGHRTTILNRALEMSRSLAQEEEQRHAISMNRQDQQDQANITALINDRQQIANNGGQEAAEVPHVDNAMDIDAPQDTTTVVESTNNTDQTEDEVNSEILALRKYHRCISRGPNSLEY